MSALKRKRTGPPPDQEAPVMATTWSETIWFADGNIVLEAEGRQFRVHQGILAYRRYVQRATAPRGAYRRGLRRCAPGGQSRGLGTFPKLPV